MSENVNEPDKKFSLGLTSLPSGTSEYDIAVSERYQKFSTELLRLSLAAIGAIGFLMFSNIFIPDGRGRFHWLISNTSFGFWLIISLLCFIIAAGLALLHFYFGADSRAYHLRYLRLEYSLGDASLVEAINKRKDFETCWKLYRYGEIYADDNANKTVQQAAYERDVRNFLLKISEKTLFFSGLFLWLGVVTLVFSFVPVIFK